MRVIWINNFYKRFWEYDFYKIYEEREINFRNICILLVHWIEFEFRYNWKDYSILNFPAREHLNEKYSHWFFMIWWNTTNFSYRICQSEEAEKLLEFLENIRIDWLTFKEIFDSWKIAPFEKNEEHDCITFML